MKTISIDGCEKEVVLAKIKKFMGKTTLIYKKAEVLIVEKILSNCWKHLKRDAKIKFWRGKGPDIIIENGLKEVIKIEVKSSRRKNDFLEKYELFGNALKYKDIDLRTGLLKEADYLIFAAEIKHTRNLFDFWIFSKKDLATLYPKATLFMPSWVPTLMRVKSPDGKRKNPFNDEFVAFKKGLYALILPPYDFKNGKWKKKYPTEFCKTWCPLCDKEHNELQRIMKSKNFQNRWEKLFNRKVNVVKNSHFKEWFSDFKKGELCEVVRKNPREKACRDCKKQFDEWFKKGFVDDIQDDR